MSGPGPSWSQEAGGAERDAASKQGCLTQGPLEGAVHQQAAQGASHAYLAAAISRSVIHRLRLGQPHIVACSSLCSFLLIVMPAGIPASTSIVPWPCRQTLQEVYIAFRQTCPRHVTAMAVQAFTQAATSICPDELWHRRKTQHVTMWPACLCHAPGKLLWGEGPSPTIQPFHDWGW